AGLERVHDVHHEAPGGLRQPRDLDPRVLVARRRGHVRGSAHGLAGDGDQCRGSDRVEEIGEALVGAPELLGLVHARSTRSTRSANSNRRDLRYLRGSANSKWPACWTMARML